MKKMIPVTLILFLCLLVAFAFLCEKVPPILWSRGHHVDRGVCRQLVSGPERKGQVLLYEDGACNGDMPVYEDDLRLSRRVAAGLFPRPVCQRAARDLRQQYGQGGLPCGLGRQVPEAVRQQDRNGPDDAGRGSICGTEMTYELRFFPGQCGKSPACAGGDGAGELTVSSGRRRLTAESDAAFQYALNEDYTGTFLADTVSAQTELTIRNPWGAQEDVVVKVDS